MNQTYFAQFRWTSRRKYLFYGLCHRHCKW